ncbi:MAG: alpha/beta fold hydrolase [Polaromonas sp.]
MSHQSSGRREVIKGIGAATAAIVLAGCAAQSNPRPEKMHYVLVHGSWHGAWCWQKLTPLLQAQGHRVTAIDLPGRNGTVNERVRLTAADYVAAVTNVLDASPEPVVLAGHSLGGGTISLAAEARPEKIRTLVYLTAFLLPSGKTMGSVAMADTASLTAKAARRDAATGVSRLDPDFVREVFYQDCSDADVALAKRLVSPEAGVMGRTPIETTPGRFGRLDRVFIECLQDHAISIGVQRSMQAAMPCRRVYSLDTSHSAFFSNPAALASALLSV